MQSAAVERFSSFVSIVRERHVKHMRFALVVAVLIALLLWQTQWIALRPALILLLLGQVGTAAILLNRRTPFSKSPDLDEAGMLAWFDTEAVFVKYLAVFENGVRAIGLLVLAYEFWMTTRNLWVALALGVVYPMTAYFGMVRGSISRTIRQLRIQKNEIETLFNR
jgi:hypothetical protein